MTADRRVLQVTSKLFQGGAESFIMNVYRNIDRSRLQFDFLVFHSEEEFYEKEISDLGGRIFRIPVMSNYRFHLFKRDLNRFFHDHADYSAIHGHMASLGKAYLGAAKNVGIEKRIAHSHIASADKTIKGSMVNALSRGFSNNATHLLACSRAAGDYMFGHRDFSIIKNGIPVESYSFSQSGRKRVRNSLRLSDKDILIGHVGRFEIQKNHDRIMDIFAACRQMNRNVKLLLIGSGKLEEDIKKKVFRLGINDDVIFAGNTDDMKDYYSAMDLFILPSLYEGLPFSVIEAQCSGLECILSDNVSNEVDISGKVEIVPLEKGDRYWAERILSAPCFSDEARNSGSRIIKDAGYDIGDTVRILEGMYLE